MNKIKSYIVAASIICSATFSTTATEQQNEAIESASINEKVIVGNDTVSMLLSDKAPGRFDRGLYNYLYIPKNEIVFGLSASYGNFSTDDMQVFSLLTDLDFGGQMYSIKPWISYFIKHNQSIGLRLNYTNASANLNNLSAGVEGFDFSINDVNYNAQSYGASVFYRNYIGLNAKKRFAFFYEADLSYLGGSSTFSRYFDGNLNETCTTFNEARLGFSPGVCVFIHKNVAIDLSFDILGLYLRDENQKTKIYDGNEVSCIDNGSYFSSGASFKLNLFSINFGLGFNF